MLNQRYKEREYVCETDNKLILHHCINRSNLSTTTGTRSWLSTGFTCSVGLCLLRLAGGTCGQKGLQVCNDILSTLCFVLFTWGRLSCTICLDVAPFTLNVRVAIYLLSYVHQSRPCLRFIKYHISIICVLSTNHMQVIIMIPSIIRSREFVASCSISISIVALYSGIILLEYISRYFLITPRHCLGVLVRPIHNN